MIRKPNFKLNWKYALGEVTLIFIGISLAIWFQNWNENRKAAQFEEEILEELLGSVLRDARELYQIQYANLVAEKAIDKTIAYSENPSIQQRDSISIWLGQFLNYDRFNSSTSAYEVLKSQGFQSIANKGLRLLIAEYYDEVVPNIIQSLNGVETDFKMNVMPLLKDEFIDFKFKEIAVPRDVAGFMANPSNVVYIKVFRDVRRGLLSDLKFGIDLIDKISEEINLEMNGAN